MTVGTPWDGAGPSIDPDVLTTAAQACRDSSRLQLSSTSAQGRGDRAHAHEEDAATSRPTMRTERLDWAASALAVAGAHVSDVQPPELVELLRSWADRLS